MRTRTIAAFIFLLLLCGGVLWWRHSKTEPQNEALQKSTERSSLRKADQPTAGADKIGTTQIMPTPRLFKSTRYPPVTPEEKAMWDWWHAMEKADPQFEWKRPIEFYGKVLDQAGEPVGGAVVHYGWTTVVEPKPDPEAETVAGADGKFSITGIHGKRLVVEVSKEGFLRNRESRGSYEYAAFHEDLFHVPDKEQPVVFRLQKLAGAEAMLKYQADARISLGAQTYLDIETGKFGPVGDLEITVHPGNEHSSAGTGYTTAIRALSGAGFVLTNDEFMFNAPDTNYRNETILTRTAAEAPTKSAIEARFYVKTHSGKFAAVELESILWERRNEATLNAVIYYNPSGSRNLEFDQRRRINR